MGTAPAQIAIVSTVKAPLEILRPWIQHHHGIGIRRFFLFLDDPEDPAREALERIDGVTVIRCSAAYWSEARGGRPDGVPPRQLANLERGMALAAAAGCEWMAHIDCDELIRPLRNLPAVLGETGAAALRLDLLEAVSEQFDYPLIFDAGLFKRLPGRGRAIVARLLGCRRAFSHGEYFRGHTQSKMIVRTDGRVVRMGVHRPLEMAEGERVEHTADLQLLHFDCIGFGDWDRKWAARVRNPHSDYGMRPARLRQLKAYAKVAGNARESRAKLFRKTQMIPAYERAVLERLGLLVRIEPG